MKVNSLENDWGLFVDIEHGLGPHSYYIDIPNYITIFTIECKKSSLSNSIYNIFSWFVRKV